MVMRPSRLSILVSSFVLCTFRYLYRWRARAASWVVYEFRALHGTSPHPASLRVASRALRPSAPPFRLVRPRSVPDGRARRAVLSNSESSCKAASGGCPLCLGPSHEKTSSILMKLVAFPLGFLGEGSLWGSSSYETGGPWGPSLRTSRHVGKRAARANAETTLPPGATQV